ncbi:MAG: Sodium/hydrogen exchanger family protein [Methanomassiliicoccales archaeon PtaU1.Bin124]|nr:MAG: Sodium/hydrogen exchanger family protein [Methanomassiliicoccales archaeon PtaU1.Bin124]
MIFQGTGDTFFYHARLPGGVNDSEALAILLTTAVLAQLIGMRFGLSAALVEIGLGIVLANVLGLSLSSQSWLVFLVSLAGVMLTFLAGAEVDRASFRQDWKASVALGSISFLVPFLAITVLCLFGLGWSQDSSLLAGVALSETSIAIVYTVLVEGGHSRTRLGSLLLSACFITNLLASIALTVIFSKPDLPLLFLIAGLVLAFFLLPRVLARLMPLPTSGDLRVKLILAVVAVLMALSSWAGVAAVLSAYIFGLALSGHMRQDDQSSKRMKALVTTLLSSFFFIAAGTYIAAEAVWAGLGVVVLIVVLRLGSKVMAVLPAAKGFKVGHPAYSALLLSTSLTFGMVFLQFGLAHGLVGGDQFSLLAASLVICAVIPTMVAERVFNPWRERA